MFKVPSETIMEKKGYCSAIPPMVSHSKLHILTSDGGLRLHPFISSFDPYTYNSYNDGPSWNGCAVSSKYFKHVQAFSNMFKPNISHQHITVRPWNLIHPSYSNQNLHLTGRSAFRFCAGHQRRCNSHDTERSFFDFSACCVARSGADALLHHAESYYSRQQILLLSQSIQSQPGCFPTQSLWVNQWSMHGMGKMVEATSMVWFKTKRIGYSWL